MDIAVVIYENIYILGPLGLMLAAILMKKMCGEHDYLFVANELVLSAIASGIAPFVSAKNGLTWSQTMPLGLTITGLLFGAAFCVVITQIAHPPTPRKKLRFAALGTANVIGLCCFGLALYNVKTLIGA